MSSASFEIEDLKFVVVNAKNRRRSGMSFEEAMLPHLDAAHNLAKWLLRNEQDAQDVVQEAYLRAFNLLADSVGPTVGLGAYDCPKYLATLCSKRTMRLI